MARFPDQDRLIEAFLASQPKEGTRNVYRNAVRQLSQWADDEGVGHIASLSSPHLDLYAQHLHSHEYSPRTLAGKQGIVKRFFDYLVVRKVIKVSPVPDGWVPRQPKRAAEEPLLGMHEVRRMLEFATDDDARAVISLSGLDGLKAEFIYALTAESVSFRGTTAVVAITRRDGNTHTVPLTPESSEVLRRLCNARPAGFLVLPSRGIAQTDPRDKAARRVSSAAKKAGIRSRVTPRILEKSFKAELIAGGAPLSVLRGRLGGQTLSGAAYAASLLPKYGTGSEGAELVSQATHESDAFELLRQAEEMCDQPGITPIAPIVIAGAALEMVLRRMCEQRGLPIQGRESIDAYSTALYRVGLISKHSHFTNQTNGKLRNEAAHGSDSADISMPKARLMVGSVTLFVSGTEPEPDEAVDG